MIAEINRVKNWVILIVLGILIVALIRGCQNNKFSLGEIQQLKERINNDSVKMVEDSISYANRIEYAEGKLELNYTQYISAADSLRSAEIRINKLLARYKPIKPSIDTSITTVPNEYIVDCAECFNELEHDKELVKYYQARVDSLKSTLHIKSKIQEQRIQQLNEEKAKIGSLEDFINEYRNAQINPTEQFLIDELNCRKNK